MLCLLQGELVPETEVRVSALDRGLLYADGLFETLRVYGGRPFLLAEHWARLTSSAAFLGIPVPPVDACALVARVLDANGLADASVRVTLTRGTLPAGPRPGPGGEPTVLVQVRPLRPDLGRNAAAGVGARRLPWPLRARGLPLQGHKTLAYLPSLVALAAVPEGEEPLLETTDGLLCEGATTNLFFVGGGRLLTPHLECGCLPGVARGLVLSLAARLGLPAEEGFYVVPDLSAAEEAFLTNSVVEVLPLVRLDGAPLAAGAPGPVTRLLQTAYAEAAGRP